MDEQRGPDRYLAQFVHDFILAADDSSSRHRRRLIRVELLSLSSHGLSNDCSYSRCSTSQRNVRISGTTLPSSSHPRFLIQSSVRTLCQLTSARPRSSPRCRPPRRLRGRLGEHPFQGGWRTRPKRAATPRPVLPVLERSEHRLRFGSQCNDAGADMQVVSLHLSRHHVTHHLVPCGTSKFSTMTWSPTNPCSGWSKVLGTVARMSKPRRCQR